MKGKARYVFAIILGAALLAGSYTLVKADSGASIQGTVSDPLVTKSYVDQLLGKGATAGAQAGLTEERVKQLIADQIKSSSPATTLPKSGTATTEVNLIVVQLLPGQTLYASSGAELIVRTGQTVAVSIDENGIPDVTAGKDLPAGTAVENNHLLIFPREGRGIKPAPKNTADIYVMVRGGYTVSND